MKKQVSIKTVKRIKRFMVSTKNYNLIREELIYDYDNEKGNYRDMTIYHLLKKGMNVEEIRKIKVNDVVVDKDIVKINDFVFTEKDEVYDILKTAKEQFYHKVSIKPDRIYIDKMVYVPSDFLIKRVDC